MNRKPSSCGDRSPSPGPRSSASPPLSLSARPRAPTIPSSPATTNVSTAGGKSPGPSRTARTTSKASSPTSATPRSTTVRWSRRTRSCRRPSTGNLVEKLTLPADAKGASLDVQVEWNRDGKRIVADDKDELTFEGKCQKTEEPDATAKSDCDVWSVNAVRTPPTPDLGGAVNIQQSKPGSRTSDTLRPATRTSPQIKVPKERRGGLRVTRPEHGPGQGVRVQRPGQLRRRPPASPR